MRGKQDKDLGWKKGNDYGGVCVCDLLKVEGVGDYIEVAKSDTGEERRMRRRRVEGEKGSMCTEACGELVA